MALIAVGERAPEIPGLSFDDGPTALWFFKVTCPICTMAGPVAETMSQAFPGVVAGVGQDPPEDLAAFASSVGTTFPAASDAPPYPASDAYGVQTVPSLVLVGSDGVVVDSVESWDRDGYNRVAEELSRLTGSESSPVSVEGDGLPPFRPG